MKVEREKEESPKTRIGNHTQPDSPAKQMKNESPGGLENGTLRKAVQGKIQLPSFEDDVR